MEGPRTADYNKKVGLVDSWFELKSDWYFSKWSCFMLWRKWLNICSILAACFYCSAYLLWVLEFYSNVIHSTRITNRIFYLEKVVVNWVLLLFWLHDLTIVATCSILLYWLHDLSIVTICSWYQAYHHNCIWIRNIRSIYLSYDRTGMIDVCGIVGTCLTSKERKCYILSTATIGSISEWLHWSFQQA